MKLTILFCLCTFAAGKIFTLFSGADPRFLGRGFRCEEEGVLSHFSLIPFKMK